MGRTRHSKNIAVDELRCDDIVVINPDPLKTRELVGPIRRRLLEASIQSHLAGVDTDPDVFFRLDVNSITFSGVYRAKGNEAGMVYIVNADHCESGTWNLATLRNQLFTAITRSKAWVRVLGVGEKMTRLSIEFQRLAKADFELRFSYPTKKQREQLKIVHRDLSPEEKKRVEAGQKSIAEFVDEIESGRYHIENLDEDVRRRLEALFGNRG